MYAVVKMIPGVASGNKSDWYPKKGVAKKAATAAKREGYEGALVQLTVKKAGKASGLTSAEIQAMLWNRDKSVVEEETILETFTAVKRPVNKGPLSLD